MLPSVASVSPMDRVESVGGGASSSVMVPVAVPSWRVAPAGALKVTVNVSVCSWVVSSSVGTRMVIAASPGANVRVPEVAV